MIFIYFIVALLFAFYAYGRYKHWRIIKKVGQAFRSSHDVLPMLADGRMIKAYTIEKTHIISSARSLRIDWISYFISQLLKFFGFKQTALYDLYRDYARALCYQDLQAQAAGMHYLVYLRESIKRFGGRGVLVFVYGNAVQRYEDSMPIFTFKPQEPKECFHIPSYMEILKRLGMASLLTLVVMVTLYWGSITLSHHLVETYTLEDEKILWSYINTSFTKDINDRIDLLHVKQEWQELINEVPIKFHGGKYPFHLHILDNDAIELRLYPAGHIVITRGLVQRVQSKNQALFILVHAMAHYNRKDHIAQLHDSIINLTLISSLFGEGSWLGRILIWPSDFDGVYSLAAEQAADKTAVDALEAKFGHIGGSDVFEKALYKPEDIVSGLTRMHPTYNIRMEELYTYIIENNYKFGEETPLEAEVEVKNLMQNGIVVKETEFSATFMQYRAAMNQQYVAYQEFLRPFHDILRVHTQTTLAELDEKSSRLDKALPEIIAFEEGFHKVVNAYDKQITNIIASEMNQEEQQKFIIIWQKEKNTVINLIDFYLERDRMILENQSVILQFLKNRFGSYNIVKNRIEFQTAKEKSDYEVLQKRIEELSRKRHIESIPHTKNN